MSFKLLKNKRQTSG